MKLEWSFLGRLYSRLKLRTQTGYLSGSVRVSIEKCFRISFDSLPRLKLHTQTVYFSGSMREWVLREVLGFFLTLYSHSTLKLAETVGVWEWVLRLVLEIIWLSTQTPHSNCLYQCEWEGEVRIIISRKALLNTQTPHSNCLYQCECEGEYWEMFLDIFWLSTQTPHSNWLNQCEGESEYWERFLDFFDSLLKLDNSVREWS